MSGNSNNMLVILLVVGLVVGAGLGYLMAPGGIIDTGSSPYKTDYNDGYDDGYAQGQKTVVIDGDYEVLETLNGLITLTYGAIGMSMIAALAAIVTLMQISRRIAG